MPPSGCCICKRRNQELKSIPVGYDGPKFVGDRNIRADKCCTRCRDFCSRRIQVRFFFDAQNSRLEKFFFLVFQLLFFNILKFCSRETWATKIIGKNRWRLKFTKPFGVSQRPSTTVWGNYELETRFSDKRKEATILWFQINWIFSIFTTKLPSEKILFEVFSSRFGYPRYYKWLQNFQKDIISSIIRRWKFLSWAQVLSWCKKKKDHRWANRSSWRWCPRRLGVDFRQQPFDSTNVYNEVSNIRARRLTINVTTKSYPNGMYRAHV